jgi:hypothetical protein
MAPERRRDHACNSVAAYINLSVTFVAFGIDIPLNEGRAEHQYSGFCVLNMSQTDWDHF